MAVDLGAYWAGKWDCERVAQWADVMVIWSAGGLVGWMVGKWAVALVATTALMMAEPMAAMKAVEWVGQRVGSRVYHLVVCLVALMGMDLACSMVATKEFEKAAETVGKRVGTKVVSWAVSMGGL